MRLLTGSLLFASLLASTGVGAYFESRPGGCSNGVYTTRKSVAVAANGDAVVTGCIHGDGSDKALTVRYDGATGAVVWSAIHKSNVGHASMTSVAIDAAGDVVVTGYSPGADTRTTLRAVKYAGDSGIERWSVEFPDFYSRGNAVAVAGNGDVYVTGENSFGGRDIRIVKFDGATGRQLWTTAYNGTVGAVDIGEAIAVDEAGDAYVTGVSGETIGASDMRTLKLEGGTGAIRWARQETSETQDSGTAIAIGPDGHPVALGYVYTAGSLGTDYRVVKYDAGSGAIRWTRNVSGPVLAADIGMAIGMDVRGDVFVAGYSEGTNHEIRTAKLASSTGELLWSATYIDETHGAYARGLAVDPRGDVIVTGSYSSASGGGMRTIKYSGSDGREIWNLAGPTGTTGYSVATDARGDVFVTGTTPYSLDSYGFRLIKYASANGAIRWSSESAIKAIPTASPGALSGVWWNPAESGWGVHINQRSRILFAAWYTYDGAGNPKWYVASRCELPAAESTGSCTGPLYETTSSGFFGRPFDPASVRASAVGTLQLTFSNADSASMTYSVGGQARTVAIQRQPLPAGPPAPVDFTDVWWNPDESGWGLAVTHRSDVMFLAWYVYDGSGKPVWYVASECRASTPITGCSGPLYRTTGPAFGPVFDSTRVQVIPVGEVSLYFGDPNNGSLTYTVDGVRSFKNVTRQLF